MILDTPKHIHKKQLDIFMNKPVEERFRLGMQMVDDMKSLIEERIRIKNSGISDLDLKIEVFKKMYRKDLSEDYINRVVEWMRSIA
jgi:hypothetical protein